MSTETSQAHSALLRPTTTPARAISALPHSCRGCTNRWSGSRTCHCSVCHSTFTGVTTFDAHRRNGECVHPVFLGMVVDERRPYECWGTSGEEER